MWDTNHKISVYQVDQSSLLVNHFCGENNTKRNTHTEHSTFKKRPNRTVKKFSTFQFFLGKKPRE